MPTQAPFDVAYRKLARSLLARAAGFERCSASTLDDWVAAGTVVRAAKGEVLGRRGEACERMLMVVEGALEASLNVGAARRHLLTFLLPGALLGYISLIDGGPRPHDLIAHVPSVLLWIPLDVVSRSMAVDPGVHTAIQVQLALRSRLLFDELAQATMFPLRERLAHRLLLLVDDLGRRRGDSWIIDLLLPQADLADLLAATRQSVNAELQALHAAGIVQVSRGAIEILDLQALRARCTNLASTAARQESAQAH